MDLNYLKKIIKILNESSLSEIKIEEEGLKIKLTKYAESPFVPNQAFISSLHTEKSSGQEIEQQVKAKEPSKVITEIPEEQNVGHIVKSPIVGTFYRAASPDSDPFVEVGQRITKGSTLCIIEAMKLMNEIESDVTGTVTKILVENGQPVEYGQPIFVIKAD
jgi:acetyl-CoA carboxylase biotin carboxyl carrier protein